MPDFILFLLYSKDVKKLEIIYEDQFCLAINKPAGLPVQGGKGIGISLDMILKKNFNKPYFLVHRLDKDTSGLIVAAKSREAAENFSHLLNCRENSAQKKITRIYTAMCKGKTADKKGIITADLAIRGIEKKCETRFWVLQSSAGPDFFSLLKLELGTGRTHQIRRHLAFMGNPVLGDDKFGDFKLTHELRKTIKLRNLLLHASQIIIPETQYSMQLNLTAPLPAYFQQCVNDLIFPCAEP